MVSKVVVAKILEQIGSSLSADQVEVAYTNSPSPGFAVYNNGERFLFKPARPGVTSRDLVAELLTEVDQALTRLVDAVLSNESTPNDEPRLRGNVRPHDGVSRSEPTVGPSSESGVSRKRRGRPRKDSNVTKHTSNTDTETNN